MKPNVSPARRTLALAGAILFAVIVVALVAWGIQTSTYGGFTDGAVVGAGVILAIAGVTYALRRSDTQAGRLIAGNTDERERAIRTQALAHAAVAMIIAAGPCEIGALYNMPAAAVAGVIVTVGVITMAVSAIVQARHG